MKRRVLNIKQTNLQCPALNCEFIALLKVILLDINYFPIHLGTPRANSFIQGRKPFFSTNYSRLPISLKRAEVGCPQNFASGNHLFPPPPPPSQKKPPTP